MDRLAAQLAFHTSSLVEADSTIQANEGITAGDVFSVVATAALTFLFVWIYDGIKSWRQNKSIRSIIKMDLYNLRLALSKLQPNYEELIADCDITLAGQDPKESVTFSTFEELSTSIYDSIPMTALYSTFGSNLMDINRVYQEVRFLSENGPMEMIDDVKIALEKPSNAGMTKTILTIHRQQCTNNLLNIQDIRTRINDLDARKVFA